MKTIATLVFGTFLGAIGVMLFAQNVRTEAMTHPRIAAAIRELRDARAYMEAAPHDFGGHKASAIRATDAAIRELGFALAFRAREDRGR